MTAVRTAGKAGREHQDSERRQRFIERMERKLAYKTALRHQKRQLFRMRLQRLRDW